MQVREKVLKVLKIRTKNKVILKDVFVFKKIKYILSYK